MALTATDWTIDRLTGNIRYTGDDHHEASPSYATVIQFHRWLQELADDATPAAADDEVDITATNPSQRSTNNIITLINGYNVNDAAVEHLYDGTITQDGGDTIYDGIVNFGNTNVQIQIIQNGAIIADDYWNYGQGDDATGGSTTTLVDTGIGWTPDEWIGYTILNTSATARLGSRGIVTGNTSDTLTFAGGCYGGATAQGFANTDSYLIGVPLNYSLSQGISHRFMIKTRASGADIDAKILFGICRRYGNTYAEFKINGTSPGNNVLALNDTGDLNNTTAQATIDAYTDVHIDWTDSTTTVDGVNAAAQPVLDVINGGVFTKGDFISIAGFNQEYQILSIASNALTLTRDLEVATAGSEVVYDLNIGFTVLDIDLSTVDENYYAQWDRGAQTINNFFQYTKNISCDGTNHYVYGLSGELFRGITHEVVINNPTGTFAPVEGVSWTGGTGQMFAINSPTAGTKMWIQLLTGVAPSGTLTITGAISTATADVNTTVTDRSSLVATPFVGASTGSALIGSYGLALQPTDLTAADKVFDLDNAQITPPNNITNTITGVVSGEDRILVAPTDGLTEDINGDPSVGIANMTLATILDADNETAVVVSEDLTDADIVAFLPASGFLQVVDDAGRTRRLAYSGYVGATKTFTITTTTGDEDFLGDEAAVGSAVTVGQMYLVTALTTGAEVAAAVNIIPGSTPANGTMRIVNDEGYHIPVVYSAYDDPTDIFTITSSDWSGTGLTANAKIGNHAYVTYLDLDAAATSANYQAVYDIDLNLVVVVRDGKGSPIKQFIASWAFTSADGTISAIRTTDA